MLKILTTIVVFLSSAAWCEAPPTARILKRRFSLPSPVKWKLGKMEISLIGMAWGPANSKGIASLGNAQASSAKSNPCSAHSYVLGLDFQARRQVPASSPLRESSRLVMVTKYSDDSYGHELPANLTPRGFVNFPGTIVQPGETVQPRDILFNRAGTAEFWDFFAVPSHRRIFLFYAFGPPAPLSSDDTIEASFEVRIGPNGLTVVNVPPGARHSLPVLNPPRRSGRLVQPPPTRTIGTVRIGYELFLERCSTNPCRTQFAGKVKLTCG